MDRKKKLRAVRLTMAHRAERAPGVKLRESTHHLPVSLDKTGVLNKLSEHLITNAQNQQAAPSERQITVNLPDSNAPSE